MHLLSLTYFLIFSIPIWFPYSLGNSQICLLLPIVTQVALIGTGKQRSFVVGNVPQYPVHEAGNW